VAKHILLEKQKTIKKVKKIVTIMAEIKAHPPNRYLLTTSNYFSRKNSCDIASISDTTVFNEVSVLKLQHFGGMPIQRYNTRNQPPPLPLGSTLKICCLSKPDVTQTTMKNSSPGQQNPRE